MCANQNLLAAHCTKDFEPSDTTIGMQIQS